MVMPHTYRRTWPGSIGVKASVARVSVLWMRSVMEPEAVVDGQLRCRS